LVAHIEGGTKAEVFENRVLRGKRHSVELNDLYSLPNNIWMIETRVRCVGHVANLGEKSGVNRVLVGKPEGKRSLGKLRRK